MASRSAAQSVHGDDSDSESALSNMSLASHISFPSHGAGADLDTMAMVAASATLPRSTAASEVGEHDGEPIAIDEEATIMSTVKQFAITGYPLTLSALAQFSLNAVIIAVIGRMLGVEELGGASLALGLINATGFAFGAGLCGALETVLSHVYGTFVRQQEEKAKREGREMKHNKFSEDARLPMYGIYAQRMIIILLVAAVPLGIILCFADSLMSLVGESESAVYYTGVWCRYGMFGIPAALLYQLVQRYYSCQHITKPLSVAMVGAALLNPLLQYAAIKVFGFRGSPVAWLLLMCMICAGLVGYLYYSGRYRLTWGGWSKKSTKNIPALLTIALPSMGVMMSEWVALEINALAAGFASPVDLAGYSITLQVFGLMWGIGSGVIILTCVFVGNAIGAGKPLLGRRVAFIGIGTVFFISVVDILIILILEDYIPYIFTADEEAIKVYKSLMYIVLPYHIFDTFQSTVMSIMRGCELQLLAAGIITVVFCLVGIPVSFTLFFHFDIGVKALWIGPFFGVVVVGFPTYIYVLLRYIDWANLKPHAEEGHTAQAAEEITIEA